MAISLVSGSLIAVDVSAFGLGEEATNSVPVDFIDPSRLAGPGALDESFLQPRLAAIETVPYVLDAEPLFSLGICSYVNDSGGAFPLFPPSNTIVFLGPDDEELLERYRIVGGLPSPGTAAVSREVAQRLSLTVGENITCSFSVIIGVNTSGQKVWANISLPVSQVWTQEMEVRSPTLVTRPDNFFTSSGYSVVLKDLWNPVIVRTEDVGWVLDELAPLGNAIGLDMAYLIWIDRERVVDYASFSRTLDRLQYVEHRLAALSQSYGDSLLISRESELILPLRELDELLDSMGTLFVSCSVPVIVLGAYASVAGVDLGIESRRKEVRLLITRGAGKNQLLGSTVLESALIGGLAGVIGLGSGILVTRFVLGGTLSDLMGAKEFAGGLWHVGLNAILVAVFLGVLLAVASSIRLLRVALVTTFHGSAAKGRNPEIRRTTATVFDLAMLALACWSVASVLAGTSWSSALTRSWVGSSLGNMALTVGIVSIPLMPFLLTASIVRLVCRHPKAPYTKLREIVRFWTREIDPLIEKNLTRDPRRTSVVSMIVAFTLAFGILISATTESSLDYERELVAYELGSDALVEGIRGGTDAHLGNLYGIGDLQGIASASTIQILPVVVDTYEYGPREMEAVILDPESYAETVDPSPYFFIESENEGLAGLAANGTALVSREFAEQNDVIVHDILRAIFYPSVGNGGTPAGEWHFALEVVGVVRGLPGLPNASLFVSLDSLDFIPLEDLESRVFFENAIIRLSEDADAKRVVENVQSEFVLAGLDPSGRLLTEEIDSLKGDLHYGILAFFLRVEYALTLAIATVGILLLMIVTVRERRYEMAAIVARGASASQVRKLVIGESAAVLFLGAVVGISVGLSSTFLLNQAFANQITTIIPREVVLETGTGIMLLSSIVAMLVSSVVGAFALHRSDLSRSLRNRGYW